MGAMIFPVTGMTQGVQDEMIRLAQGGFQDGTIHLARGNLYTALFSV